MRPSDGVKAEYPKNALGCACAGAIGTASCVETCSTGTFLFPGNMI